MGQQSIAAAQPRVSRASAAFRLVSFVSFFFVLSSAQTTQTASTEDAHDILHETTTTPPNNKTPTIISSSVAAVEKKKKMKKKMNDIDDICFVTGKPPAHVATPLTARYVPRLQPGDPSCCSPCEAYDLVRCRRCSVSHEQANCCPKPCELYYFVSDSPACLRTCGVRI